MRTLFRHPITWVALLAVLAGVPAALAWWKRGAASEPPPVLGQVPGFVLTDQSGARFDVTERLRGQVWIANFIFTRCPDICPTFTAKMALVQEKTAGPRPPHLVSFSVDPGHDTPEVLAAYAAQHGARSERWSFLTGPFVDVRAAVENAMKVHMGQDGSGPGGASVPNISHGSHFVLVDGQMRIRGYYDMNDADAVARVVRDAARVGAEPASRSGRKRGEAQPAPPAEGTAGPSRR